MDHVTLLLAHQASSTADPFFWYVTRTMAVGAYITLTLAVMLGLLKSIGRAVGEHISWRVDELHTFVSVLAGVLVAGHLTALLLDPFLPFSLTNLLIPVNQPFKPFAVNLGVFAFYAIVALLLSSYLKARIPYGVWRAIHYVSFIAFVLVTLHGWLAGSDAGTNWMPAIYVGSLGAVVSLTIVRFVASDAPSTTTTQPKTLWQSKVAMAFTVAFIVAVFTAGLTFMIMNVATSSQQGALQHLPVAALAAQQMKAS